MNSKERLLVQHQPTSTVVIGLGWGLLGGITAAAAYLVKFDPLPVAPIEIAGFAVSSLAVHAGIYAAVAAGLIYSLRVLVSTSEGAAAVQDEIEQLAASDELLAEQIGRWYRAPRKLRLNDIAVIRKYRQGAKIDPFVSDESAGCPADGLQGDAALLQALCISRLTIDGELKPAFVGEFLGVESLPAGDYPAIYSWVDTSAGGSLQLSHNTSRLVAICEEEAAQAGLELDDDTLSDVIGSLLDWSSKAFEGPVRQQ